MEAIHDLATEYQRANRHKLMVLTKWRNATPERDEFCHIRSVETLTPSLWISAIFLEVASSRPVQVNLARRFFRMGTPPQRMFK